MKTLLLLIFTIVLPCVGHAENPEPANKLKNERIELESEIQRYSYALGANIGKHVTANNTEYKNKGVELDLEMIVNGFRAAISGESILSVEEIRDSLKKLEKLPQKLASLADDKKSEEQKHYFAENAKSIEVSVTESGLQFEVLKKSDGIRPTVKDIVKVHYIGKLIDGTTFDSSVNRGKPLVVSVDKVLPGWIEGLQLMNVGSKFRFFIPPELAYGDRAIGNIPSNSILIFDIELLAIEPHTDS